MALFKVYEGVTSDLNQVAYHEGYCYFVTDDGTFYVDVGGNRIHVNANNAATAVKLKSGSNEIEISDLGTNVFTPTLAVANWSGSAATGFTYSYANTALKCGKDGTLSPIVSCLSNATEYNYITGGTATAGSGIVFTASKKPTGAINIQVTDIKY